MSKSSITFIVETTNCADANGLISEISQVLESRGFNNTISFISDGGKGGSLIFNEPVNVEPALQAAPEVPTEAPQEFEITLGSAPDNNVDLAASAVGLGHLPEPTVDLPPAPPEVAVVPEPEVAVEPVAPVLKSGIVFIKSLLPSEPVPFKCDLSKDLSELHVNNVSYQPDIVNFTYRNTVFKFPIEQDRSTPEFAVIRVVLSVDTSTAQLAVFLKVVENHDDNHVVFGNQDTEQLGLIEQLSTQS